MNYKEQTREAYSAEAVMHADKFIEAFLNRTKVFVDEFLALVPEDGRILDLGCGPGAHAGYMAQHGRKVEGLDLTPEFVEMAKKQGVMAVVGDMETVEYPAGSFFGIWCYTSLLHIAKESWPEMLKKMTNWLTEGGILYLALKEGEGEAWDVSKTDPEKKRFFAFATQEELEPLLKNAGLTLLKPIFRNTHPNGRVVFLMALCQKA